MADNQATDPQEAGEQETVVAPAEERPAWLVAKYKTVEEQAKGYAEIEKKWKQSTMKPAETIAVPEEAGPQVDEEAGIDDVLATAGLDSSAVGAAWVENGELTQEQYAALKKIGYTKGVVNQFLRTQQALQGRIEKEIIAAATTRAGGQEQLKNLLAWSATGLTKDEKAWYNNQLNDAEGAMRAFEWLQAKHRETIGAGKTQPILEGQAAPAQGDGFTSQSEMIAAMNDPKYTKDRNYKASVNARVAKTSDNIIHGRA